VEILHNNPYIFIPMITLEDARRLVQEASIQLEVSVPPTIEQIDILEAQDLPAQQPAKDSLERSNKVGDGSP
jgi:hypothetical protein